MSASQPCRRPWYYKLPRRLRLHIVFLRAYWWRWLKYVIFFWSSFPTWLIEKLGPLLLTRGRYEGIRLVCSHFGEATEQVFVECTTDALNLIRQYAPRHFRYLLKEVRIIDNAPLIYGGRYRRRFHACEVDFPRYQNATQGFLDPRYRGTDEYERSLAYYAATLIHETTHGRLYSFGIISTRETCLRIERLCHREEERFYARLEQQAEVFDGVSEFLEPFPEEYYRAHYHATRWNRWKRGWEYLCRVRESWQHAYGKERGKAPKRSE
jgi:hypothetical protein